MSSTILDQLKAAVAARKDSLESLRSRMEELIAEIPIGVVLADDDGEIGKIQRVCTGASQWANRTWDVTILGKGLVVSNKLAVETCDRSYSDGSNVHYHRTEGFYLGSDSEGNRLSWLSGRETRALALRLPRAIEKYIQECESERTANEAAALLTAAQLR